MIKVRLHTDYPNWFWNSATGVTIRKDNREGVFVNESDSMISLALKQGILEVLPDSEVITDSIPKNTIKEIVTPTSKAEVKEVLFG